MAAPVGTQTLSDHIPSTKTTQLPISQVPPLRGEPFWRKGEKLFLSLVNGARRWLPTELNPFAQMGAVADTNFFIAIVTGIVLLLWYIPSVHQAFSSVEALKQGHFLGQLMRSLHRYSSDACLLFAVLHGFQTLFARKFTGPRWLAWVTGMILVGLLWFDGWTGYWLVWDERSRQVALGSAKMLDVLPIFADPLSRAFLTDQSLNSLLFFLIFFVHMLIPLAMGIALWLHIMRLNKSAFVTGKKLTLAIILSLTVVSILFPAHSAPPARMQVEPSAFTVDWFYLFPLFLTDRLQGGLLWLAAVLPFCVFVAFPWALKRRKPPMPQVNPKHCNACRQCYEDCPYNAITMRPREGKYPEYAYIDQDRCVDCGICVGACDPMGVEYPLLPAQEVRTWLKREFQGNPNQREDFGLAVVCAESAGAQVLTTERAAAWGWKRLLVPCIGWLHPLVLEQAAARGAKALLVIGCGDDPLCRLGPKWLQQRLASKRHPELRPEKLGGVPLETYFFNRGEEDKLSALLAGAGNGQKPLPKKRSFLTANILLGLLTLLLVAVNAIPYQPPKSEHPLLVISFKHPGQLVEVRASDPEAQAKLLPHMRSPMALVRKRLPVRLSVKVDGEEKLHRSYAPHGVFGDENSLAIETLAVPAGSHRVEVFLGDDQDTTHYAYQFTDTLDFTPGVRRVVLFDKVHGFQAY